MNTTKANISKQQEGADDVKSLKGTLVSTGIVGAVIVIMWVAVFWLYMTRL
ncbi:cytochrome c oxidase subunit 2A [Virgibacillus dakarensis]|uniref:Cytochrome c oxidase subunit 2A n=1 Tax=Lentibacillus populi TaxID=1827502 RepID=A0A9W5X5E0_9BACI|nr:MULTISPECIES: cytochrome c oxidase subunit 2A [Bacillaceae]MBT2215359.1 cytochrome c oxidase subunit 2A [Virgibacillus dakarensis]MTW85471.1 cytochrome c oxidase subunit 2A [Virgibacillus dakarensis]GGB39553.1 hypothetical protein GCM10011409_16320 [Lentibacillus populi]